MLEDLGGRSEYGLAALNREELPDDPVELLRQWLAEAVTAGVIEPSAMCLSTVSEGRPSSRMVLLRGLDGSGLTFFSNYLSRKGSELDANPYASVCFWWGALERQVRVEGRVERVSAAESDAYFASRPRESQLASAASPQSQVVATRDEIVAEMDTMAWLQPTQIMRPAHWGGYRLQPDAFEFWQGGRARLHDRFRYEISDSGWNISRLAP